MKSQAKATFFFVKIIFCIAVASAALYAHIQKQNELTALKMMIPIATKELKALEEENVYLQFKILSFENPQNLLDYAKQPQYGHLYTPENSQIIILQNQPPLE